ncbi:hypothetical protein BGZ97_007328 [Linnemannia gamsii]|uniref:Uncharacterized protein n=1 Tax=Linnemannia gamsii TaxID=64522 RepID=A0A9P6QNC4_9FUNG|nr:hypothetical protein BGZ97_007328 [Linnemannia gamsii]
MASAEATHSLYANASPTHPPTTIDPPRIQQLVVTDTLLQLIPSLSGNDFFAAPSDPELDHVYTAELYCAKNPMQQYTAPGWDLPWPANQQGAHYHFERALCRILERITDSTRPIDEFAAEFVAKCTDVTVRTDVAEFLHIARSQQALIARDIQQLRRENFLRAKGLQPAPEKKKGVTISKDTITADIKAAEDYAKAQPPKNNTQGGAQGGGRGHRGGRGRGGGGRFFGQHQQQPQYQQQQYYQQQQQPYAVPYQQPAHYQQQPPFAFQPQGFSDFSGYGQQPPQGFRGGRGGRGRGRGQTSQ